jgi:ArsR family transcriptional regulator
MANLVHPLVLAVSPWGNFMREAGQAMPVTQRWTLSTVDPRYIVVLKALAGPSRLRICWLLASIDRRICVAEAMDVLGCSHYNASRDLAMLRNAGLVSAHREGKWVYYELHVDQDDYLAAVVAAIRKIPAKCFKEEVNRCKQRLALRDGDKCVVGPNLEPGCSRNTVRHAGKKGRPPAKRSRTVSRL